MKLSDFNRQAKSCTGVEIIAYSKITPNGSNLKTNFTAFQISKNPKIEFYHIFSKTSSLKTQQNQVL